MKRIFLCCVIFMLLLCGCANVPENVQNNADILDGKKPIVTEPDKEINDTIKQRGTLDDIRTQLKYDLDNNHTRISIDNARVGTGAVMPTTNIKIIGKDLADGGGKAYKSMIDIFFKGMYDTKDESNYYFHDKEDAVISEYPYSETYFYDDEGVLQWPNAYFMDLLGFHPNKGTDDFLIYSYAHGTGHAFGYSTNKDEFYYLTAGDVEKVLQKGLDDLSVSYQMYDGTKWAVSDAVKYAEDFYNNNLHPLDVAPCTYEVHYVYVIKMQNGNYGYCFELSRKDENGNYLENTVRNAYEKDWDDVVENRPFFMPTNSMLWTFEVDKTSSFEKGYSFEYLDTTDSGNDFLTLNEAIKKLDEKLAPEKALSVPCEELSYTVFCKGYPYYDAPYVDKSLTNWHQMFFNEDMCIRDCDFELKPMWVFKTKDRTIFNNSVGEIYFVDAITGEVHKIK